MGKTIFWLTVASVFWIALVCPSPFPANSSGNVVTSAAWAATEEFSYHDDEILMHFSEEENAHHYAHLSGMLVQLWKEQRNFFKVRGKGENTVAAQVEDLFNDSSLAASEDNYHEAYVSLRKVYELLKGSLDEMGIKNGK